MVLLSIKKFNCFESISNFKLPSLFSHTSSVTYCSSQDAGSYHSLPIVTTCLTVPYCIELTTLPVHMSTASTTITVSCSVSQTRSSASCTILPASQNVWLTRSDIFCEASLCSVSGRFVSCSNAVQPFSTCTARLVCHPTLSHASINHFHFYLITGYRCTLSCSLVDSSANVY